MPDPIHQFEIHPLIPIKVFGWDVSFTNSSAFMLLAVILITAFLMTAMRGRSLVPTRLQSMAEISHEFVAGMLRDSIGKEGMKFFPFVFALFIFIFVCNMLGMIPGFFTVTSHIVVTAALAGIVFLTVLAVGFAKNGVKFLKLFVPELRLVVLATQEKLGYGPTFAEAMNSLFGEAAVKPPANEPAQPTPQQPTPTADLSQLSNRAIQEFEDYQRLTSQGKLGEAGQKLEQLKRTLDEIRQKSKP